MLFILVGKSGVGKSTIIQKLQMLGFQFPPSYTTRPKRPNDDKICISEQEFETLIPEFVEYTEYNGYKYGRKKSDILKAKDIDIIIDLEPKGIYTYIEFCQEHQIPYIVIYFKCLDQWRLQNVSNDISRLQRNDDYFDKYLHAYDLIIDVSRIPLNKIIEIIQVLRLKSD